MKFEITFSTTAETDYDLTRTEAFELAEQVARVIQQKSGMIVYVQDVDRIYEE